MSETTQPPGMAEPQIQVRAAQPYLAIAREVTDGVPAAADGRVHAGVLPAGRYVTVVHVGPYRSETAPDLGSAHAALEDWARRQGIVYSRATDRGSALPCCVEHFRVGPVEQPDFSKWETEFAYLIVEE